MQVLEPNPIGRSTLAVPQPGRSRRSLSLAVSLVIHGVVFVVWLWRPDALFVKPVFLAHGQDGTATPLSTALYLPQDIKLMQPATPSLLSIPVAARKPLKTKLQKRSNVLSRDQALDSAEAGSRSGSGLDGPVDGDEVKPGFAISFTAPRVSRWELPGGSQGDVVVELTIDAQGNVVEEKLLQGLGDGIDDRIISTLREWHFRPATRNGVAIPFKYDAHFHFPS